MGIVGSLQARPQAGKKVEGQNVALTIVLGWCPCEQSHRKVVGSNEHPMSRATCLYLQAQ